MPTSQRGLHRELLDLIRRSEGATRSTLARQTGRSRSVIAQTVGELIAEGLVIDTTLAGPRAARGRPPMELRVAPRSGYLGGVDISHDRVSVGVATVTGRILSRRAEESDADADGPGALALADRLLQQCFAELGAPATPLALGVSLPFPVHAATATVHAPAVLTTWRELDPSAVISRTFDCTVKYDNDANLGASAEHRADAARLATPETSLLYVKVGEGIGTGFIVGGRVYSGAHGMGGEIGHSAVPGGLALCRCGRRGCLEAEVSPATLVRRLGLPDAGCLAAAAGTEAGALALTEAGRAVGRVVAELSNFLDPSRVVIGGSIGSLGGPVLAGVREGFVEYGHTDTVRRMPVAVGNLGRCAELTGALELAAQQLYVMAA